MASTAVSRGRGSISISRSDTLNDLLAESASSVFASPFDNVNANNDNDARHRYQLRNQLDIAVTDASSVPDRKWLCQESLQLIQTTSTPEGREIDHMCKSLLTAEEQYSKNIEKFLCESDVAELRRRELLRHKWTNRVYEPIQREVMCEINGAQFACLLQRKRQLYNRFLESANKGCNSNDRVFLDVTVPLPQDLQPVQLTAKTGPLNDPLLLQGRCRTAEDRIIYRCETGERLSSADIERLRLPNLPLRPTGRHGTSWHTWQLMHVNDIESPVRQASRKVMHPNKNKSNITWANYYVPCSQDIVDKELGVGGRRHIGPPRRVDIQTAEHSAVEKVAEDCPANASSDDQCTCADVKSTQCTEPKTPDNHVVVVEGNRSQVAAAKSTVKTVDARAHCL